MKEVEIEKFLQDKADVMGYILKFFNDQPPKQQCHHLRMHMDFLKEVNEVNMDMMLATQAVCTFVFCSNIPMVTDMHTWNKQSICLEHKANASNYIQIYMLAFSKFPIR